MYGDAGCSFRDGPGESCHPSCQAQLCRGKE